MDSASPMVSQQLGPLVLPPGQGHVILFGGGTCILAQPIMSQPLSPTYSDMFLSPLTLSPTSSQSSEEDPTSPYPREGFVTLECVYPGCYHQLEIPEEQFRGYSFIDVNPEPLTPAPMTPMAPPQPYHEQQTPLTWQQQELLAHDTSNVAPEPAAPVKKPKKQQKPKKSFGPSKVKTEQPEAAAAPENYCRFCFSNREPVEVFTNHRMKDAKGHVICPILFKYRCELCGATGPQAHTRKYCSQQADNFGYRQGRNAIGTPTIIRY